MSAEDLKALKLPLLALVLVLLIGGGLVYYSDLLLHAAQTAYARQKNLLSEARTRLQKSGDEKETIVKYLGDYEYLQRLGFAGDEQRINWLEGLRLSNQQMRLFGVDYKIGSQQPYPYAAELNPGQITLYQSLMKIDLRLLHEGDLLNFLSTLAQQGAGVFSVNQCTIERLETGGAIRFQPNLHAECELAWLTARPPEQGKP